MSRECKCKGVFHNQNCPEYSAMMKAFQKAKQSKKSKEMDYKDAPWPSDMEDA